jgi:aldehyde dehydrogenase (NAD+)
MEAAAEQTTPVVLELGGKSANIIFDDVNLELAVPASVYSVLGVLSGQACALPTRLLVQEGVYSACVEMVAAVAQTIPVGDPADPATVMGPVVSAEHCDRILSMIDRAHSSGAGKLLTGGARLGGALQDGFFVAPTVFSDVDNSSEIAQAEVFGPVLTITPFKDADEALALANGTEYGLAGFIWTNSVKRAHQVAADLDGGVISVNSAQVAGGANVPFGGMRRSGFGREGGREGLFEFLQTKNVYINLD